jgi:galactonate dehydratase
MRITKVTPLVLGTPWRNLTFVKLDTDEGLSGVGEARCSNRTNALLGYLKDAAPRYVIGANPFEIERISQNFLLGDFGTHGEITMSVLALIEIACWDIIGKALGQPVYNLLGGPVRDKIKAYANGWYTVERTPEQFHAAARKVVERGYLALKVDPFGAGRHTLTKEEFKLSVELIEAIRDAVGPEVDILIEMHGRFNVSTAVEMSKALAPLKPAWVEEPVPPYSFEALRRVADKIDIPVASGERLHEDHSAIELVTSHSIDILQTDITHYGGLSRSRRLFALADHYDLLVTPHNVGGPVSTAAALHMAACTPNFMIQEHFNDFADSWVKAAATGVPEVIDGYFALPTAPGLGLELNEAIFAEHPQQDRYFSLYVEDWQKRD